MDEKLRQMSEEKSARRTLRELSMRQKDTRAALLGDDESAADTGGAGRSAQPNFPAAP